MATWPTLSALPWSTAVIDRQGVITAVSKAWTSHARENGGDLGRCGVGRRYADVCDGLGDPAASAVSAAISAALAGDQVDAAVEYPCHAPGQLRWYRACVVSVDDGDEAAVAVVHQPITEQVRRRAGGGQGHLGLVEVGPDLEVRFADAAWAAFRGGEEEGRRWTDVVDPPHRDQLDEIVADLVAGQRDEAVIEASSTAPGATGRVRLRLRAQRTGLGELAGIVVLASTATAPAASASADGQTPVDGRDALTGLPDRSHVDQHLALALARAQRTGRSVAVLFCDLDDFKAVNDQHGHHVGDEVLRHVAARIAGVVRPSDLLARLGGDEFVVVLSDLDDPGVAAELCQRIVTDLATPIRSAAAQATTSVGVSIGVAHSCPGVGAARLLREADAAMYRAKRQGGSGWAVADRGGERDAGGAIIPEGAVHGWRAGEMRVHHQPIVDVGTGRIVAVESLIRWVHPQLGLLPAAAFLPPTLADPDAVDLAWWALSRSLVEVAALPPDVGVHLNLSPRQLMDRRRLRGLREQLQGVAGGRQVTLEVTEDAFGADAQRLRDVLLELRADGFAVALDDFGAGWSSFSRLRTLPTDVVKVDKSLIRGAPDDEHARRILEGVVRLGASVGTDVVAEGVERADELALVRHLGVRLVQGQLLHPPMPLERVQALL